MDAQPPRGSAAARAPGAPRSVLYIEDDRLNVVLMEALFGMRPEWSLAIAEDGAEGLKLARALRPSLVLIDMNLPDTSGLALIKVLRADPATRPLRCVALSADTLGEQVDAALAAGFDAYWSKPIDLPRILQALGHELR